MMTKCAQSSVDLPDASREYSLAIWQTFMCTEDLVVLTLLQRHVDVEVISPQIGN